MEQLYYKYAKMELEQFAIFDENIQENNEEIQFQTQVQFSFDKEQNTLICKIKVMASKDSMPIMKADMSSYFVFQKESIEQLRMEYGHLVFVPHLLVQFASLNYGSLRGIIYLKTQNTPLSNYVLPPVFFAQIIDKAFEVE